MPVHTVCDAQGEMGICDADGKAVVWASETHGPRKGYVWEPSEKPRVHRFEGEFKTTFYKERCELMKIICNLINRNT